MAINVDGRYHVKFWRNKTKDTGYRWSDGNDQEYKVGNLTNEDFIKLIGKEMKIYQKHGENFLWGKLQEEKLKKQKEFYALHSKNMT